MNFNEYTQIKILLESTNNIGIIAFSRMNPVTIGHLKLMKKMVELGKQYKATPLLYLSHTQDKKKNPLSYEDKYKFVKSASPTGLSVVKSNAKNIFDAIKETVQLGVKILYVVAGSDRIQEFKRFEKYKEELGLKTYEVISAGERDPDADGAEGISASKLRLYAQNGNFEEFSKGAGTYKNKATTQKMYTKVRIGLGLE